jgi:glycosyltransferase involved in cell wall biosynthesis
MDKSVVSANFITYQCLTLDYPFEATFRCCMDFCDYLYINDGGSTDGTLDILHSLRDEYGKDRVKLFVREWTHDRRFWTDQKNFLIEQAPDDHYILCMDVDEVMHEKDIDKFRQLVDEGHQALSFPFIHFYGKPTHYSKNPNWYKRHTRMWKKSTGIKLVHRPGGCADDVLWPNGQPAHFSKYKDTGILFYHYSWCRHPKAFAMKQRKADAIYQNSLDYVDGSLPETRSFDYNFDPSQLGHFKDSHPKYVAKWYMEHKNQPTKYVMED